MDTCFKFSACHFLACMGLLCLSAPALAYEGEFLLFPTLTGIHRNSPMMDHPQNEIKPSLDMGGFKFKVQQLMVAWCSTPTCRRIPQTVFCIPALCVAGG